MRAYFGMLRMWATVTTCATSDAWTTSFVMLFLMLMIMTWRRRRLNRLFYILATTTAIATLNRRFRITARAASRSAFTDNIDCVVFVVCACCCFHILVVEAQTFIVELGFFECVIAHAEYRIQVFWIGSLSERRTKKNKKLNNWINFDFFV